MKFADYPFLRYLPFLLGGIFFGNYISGANTFFLYLIVMACWIGYVSLLAFYKKPKLLSASLLAYCSLIMLGVLISTQKQTAFQLSVFDQFDTVDYYLAEVTQYDISKPNSFENSLEVKSVHLKDGWKDASGKVLIYHQSSIPFEPGMVILVKKMPDQIASPSNPGEFDYRSFLIRKGIYFRQFLGTDFQIIATSSSTQYPLARLRHNISEMLASKIPDEQSRQIAMALLLGEKKSLDPEVRESYAQAGVLHILAVSGLHVGIIYMIFIFLMKPLKLSKNKAKVYLLIVIFGIWGYALLTGMSPSVVRAAIMFTLLTLGQMRERKPSIYNILAFSAMLTIVVNPDVIYEVGFQLSYLAVLGIVLIQPILVRIWIPKRRVVEYFWQLSTVSFAAQLVTFPLSVYYFHVFPTYFLIGNLLILPLAFLIMNVGVPLLFLGWIPVLGDMIGWLLSKLILFQNWLTFLIQTIPGGKIDRLTFDFVQMLVIWLLLLVIVSWELGSKKKLIGIAFLVLTVGMFYSVYMEASRPVNQLVTYVGKNGRLFDLVIDRKLYSWNTGMTASEVSFMIDPNRIQNHWPHIPQILHAIPSSNNEVELRISGLKAIIKEDLLQFHSPSLIRMEVWQQGTWQTISNRDVLKMEPDEAYRFLF